ncbi:MAG TPA: hypothetical protein VF190_08560 [Rhodothermales bacterium]
MGLDEFLCEYVDGTMDPAVRAAFEEYLRLNPELYEHVQCLRETRSMLCRYGCRLRAPEALQQRLRERLGEEMLTEPPVLPAVADRLSWIAGFSSVVLLLIGFLAADSLLESDSRPSVSTVTAAEIQPFNDGAQMRSLVREPSRPAPSVLPSPALSWRGRSRVLRTSTDAPMYDSIMTTIGELRPSLTSATLP